MEIIKVETLNEVIIQEILEVWEASVIKTHTFLNKDEISNIKSYVPLGLNNVEHLVLLLKHSKVQGFMGISKGTLEMLFIHPNSFNKGYGRILIDEAINKYNVNKLVVNEQNPNALEFYKHIGSRVYKRSDVDEQGNPYPILYMEYIK